MTSPGNPFDSPPAGAPQGQQQAGPQRPPAPSYGQPSSGPQQFAQAPGSYGPPPAYGTQPPATWHGAPRTETKAMVALGLAIAAWTPTIPFVGAIAAIVLARMARRDIEASGGALEGLPLCTWATVLSVVHLVVVGLFFLVLVAVFLLPLGLGVGF